MAGDERWLLAEMLREAERVVDRTFRMAEEQDDKTEQLIVLSIASLGGGLALATFAANLHGFDLVGLGLLAGGGVSNLGALHRLLGSYAGMPRVASLAVGPDLDWLVARGDEPAWTDISHLRAVLRSMAKASRMNLATLELVRQRRRTGTSLLVVSLGSFALAACYIVGRTVVA